MRINNKHVLIRRFVYFMLYAVDKILMRKNNLFILCYHSISTDDWFYSVSFTEFKAQIEYLKKSGYQFVTLDDVYNHVTGVKQISSPSVALTIDDGYSDNLDLIEYFNQEKITPVLFLITDKDQVNREELATDKKLLTDNEVKKIKKSKWEIGVHSSSHSNLSRLSREKLVAEITESKKVLEKIINEQVNYFAYPFGSYNNGVLSKVKSAGYKMAMTMDDGTIGKGTDLFRIPRIGVNNTHSLNEFKTIFSPSVVEFRKIVKKLIN